MIRRHYPTTLLALILAQACICSCSQVARTSGPPVAQLLGTWISYGDQSLLVIRSDGSFHVRWPDDQGPVILGRWQLRGDSLGLHYDSQAGLCPNVKARYHLAIHADRMSLELLDGGCHDRSKAMLSGFSLVTRPTKSQ